MSKVNADDDVENNTDFSENVNNAMSSDTNANHSDKESLKIGRKRAESDNKCVKDVAVHSESNERMSEIDAKKMDMLVQIKRMIRECGEVKHELIDLKSYAQHTNNFGSEKIIYPCHVLKNINYSTLISICRKIIVNCCSLDTLPIADLQFLQQIAYAAVLRKETRAKAFKEHSPDFNTCLARVEYLRTILQEAKESTKLIRSKMKE